MRNWRKMWIIEFFIETIVKDSELISLPFTAVQKQKKLILQRLSVILSKLVRIFRKKIDRYRIRK